MKNVKSAPAATNENQEEVKVSEAVETTVTNVAPVAPKPKTIDELRSDAKEANKKLLDENPDLSDEDRFALQMQAYKASKLVIDFINAEKVQAKLKEIEAAKTERASIVDKLIELYVANQAAVINDALTIDDKNVANNAYQTQLQIVKDEVVRSMPKATIVVPAGMTGAKAAKAVDGLAATNGKGKGAEVMELLEAGKTKEELLSMGYADGTIRSAQWKINSARKAAL